jgi:hypothetical protein
VKVSIPEKGVVFGLVGFVLLAALSVAPQSVCVDSCVSSYVTCTNGGSPLVHCEDAFDSCVEKCLSHSVGQLGFRSARKARVGQAVRHNPNTGKSDELSGLSRLGR